MKGPPGEPGIQGIQGPTGHKVCTGNIINWWMWTNVQGQKADVEI